VPAPALIRTTAVAALLLAACGCTGASTDSGGSLTLKKADFGADWPLTVAEATVVCGKANRLMVESGGTTYYLNGLAKGDHKWADLFLIWADDPDVPGLKKDMGPLTEKALGYCQGR